MTVSTLSFGGIYLVLDKDHEGTGSVPVTQASLEAWVHLDYIEIDLCGNPTALKEGDSGWGV